MTVTPTSVSTAVGAAVWTLTAISRSCASSARTVSSSASVGSPPGAATTTSTVPSPRAFGITDTAATPSTARARARYQAAFVPFGAVR